MKLYFFIFLLTLTACAENTATGNAAYDLELAKGRATSAAVETAAQRAANAVATGDARTRSAVEQDSTRAAQMEQNALLYAQATSTAASQFAIATSTARYVVARGAETTQAEQARYNATQTARAANATATRDAQRWQATATAERRTREAEQARVQATATAQVLDAQIKQAQVDAEQNAQRSMFISTLTNFMLVVVGIMVMLAACVVIWSGAFAFIRYLESRAARSWLVETRAGTIQIQRGANGTYIADIISRNESAPTFPAYDAPTQLPATASETDDLMKVTRPSGTTLMLKEDPDAARREAEHKLVLDLLRAAMLYYKSQHQDPRTCARIPTWHTLSWSAASWQKAIDLLRPHITTQDGRGGGTFCGVTYPNLMALYVAVGEHRAPLAFEDLSRAA